MIFGTQNIAASKKEIDVKEEITALQTNNLLTV